MDERSWLLVRIEKIIHKEDYRSIYLIDFVVEEDFQEIKGDRVYNQNSNIYKLSFMILDIKGFKVNFIEDEVIQVKKNIISNNISVKQKDIDSYSTKEHLSSQLKYTLNFPHIWSIIKIEVSDENEGFLLRRRMIRTYSKRYSFLSDYKLYKPLKNSNWSRGE